MKSRSRMLFKSDNYNHNYNYDYNYNIDTDANSSSTTATTNNDSKFSNISFYINNYSNEPPWPLLT